MWGVFLLFLLGRGGALTVERHNGGDLFENLGSSIEYCTLRNAACSMLRLDNLDANCSSIPFSGDISCRSCACTPGRRYSHEVDACVVATCPGYAGFQLRPSVRNQVSGPEQSLTCAVNTTFSCEGRVIGWRYILISPTGNTFFYLQVWRMNGDAVVRVGSTRIDVSANSFDGNEDITHYLDESEQIPVEPGDFLGILAPQGLENLPIGTRRFQDENQPGSEVYVFFVSNGVLPVMLNLSERDLYHRNAFGNFQAITDYSEGQVQCFNLRPVSVTLTSNLLAVTNCAPTTSSRPVSETPNPCTNVPTAVTTTSQPTNRLSSVKSSSPVQNIPTQLIATVTPRPSQTALDRANNSTSTDNADLTPQIITLIVAFSVFMLLVHVILIILCLIWRIKRKKPVHVESYSLRKLASQESHTVSQNYIYGPSGGRTSEVCPESPREGDTSGGTPYYHILSETEPHLQNAPSSTAQATVSIHIHCDGDPRLELQHSHDGSEQVFNITVPTKEERVQKVERYSKGGPKTDGECNSFAGHEKESEQYFHDSASYWTPADNEDDLYYQLAENNYQEIFRKYIRLEEALGSGHFGSVQKGTCQTEDGPIAVAVKALKPGNDKVKFLQEAAIMGQFSHPNIVKLHGVVTVVEPVMIVLELMSNGDLRNHLLALRDSLGQPVSQEYPHHFLQFSRQIAAGMEYLSTKGFIHRDLAARNILLNEELVCKIGDFGMARDLLEEDYYYVQGGPIPIKWTAPEALNFLKFTTASDVWSYGVVLFEIWSVGRKPFSSINNLEVISLVSEGHRLPPPPGCSKEIYKLMLDCWHPDPSKRPTFGEIIEMFLEDDASLLTWQEEWYPSVPRAQVPNGCQASATNRSGQTQHASKENQPMVAN